MNTDKQRRIIVALIIGLGSLAISVQSFAKIRTLEKQSLIFVRAISTKHRKLYFYLQSTCIGELEGTLQSQSEGYMYRSEGKIRFKLDSARYVALDFSLRLAINGLYQVGGSVLRFWNPSNPEKQIVLGTLGIDPIQIQGSIDGSENNLIQVPFPGPVTLYPTGEGTFGLQIPSLEIPIPVPLFFKHFSYVINDGSAACSLTDNVLPSSVMAEISDLLSTVSSLTAPSDLNSAGVK